jgi:hypothetical protein
MEELMYTNNGLMKMTVHRGCDVRYGANLHPPDREGCVGKQGLDKKYTLAQVVALAQRMPEKPNIIIKAGANAKWYLKKCAPAAVEREVGQNNWRDVSRCLMYVIDWAI